MSDEEQAKQPAGGDAAPRPNSTPSQRTLPVPQLDWLLESMVADANHSGTYGVPVTLLTNGGAVTGIMISMQEYCQAAGEWWTRAAGDSPNYGGQMKDYLANIAEEEVSRLSNAAETEFSYIHLKDVRHIGTVVAPEPGLLWRGRLSEITGFALGALSPKPVTITMQTKRG
jgi:hypothetical protein